MYQKAFRILEYIATLGGHANAHVTTLFRYALSAWFSFALDLTLLWLLVRLLDMHYTLAATIGFIVASSVQYAISRVWAFRGTRRNAIGGYVRFIFVALVGLGIIVGGMIVLVEKFLLPYIIARILIAGIAGLWNFSLNAYWNFNIVRK